MRTRQLFIPGQTIWYDSAGSWLQAEIVAVDDAECTVSLVTPYENTAFERSFTELEVNFALLPLHDCLGELRAFLADGARALRT